jgi:DNA-binding LytR/AlgR family response regulator
VKLKLQKKEELQEAEVEIAYPKMTENILQMIRYIKQYEFVLEGVKEDKNFQIPLEQVYYVETTDRKTFIYLEQDIYESRQAIQSIETLCEGTTIVRIGKSVLLNISMLKSVKPYPNHRIMVELLNEEKLLVSRKYSESLKERIRREYGA